MKLCDYCNGETALVTGAVIYPRRPDLATLRFYLCRPCDAYVGCHPTTSKPLGRLANKSLRILKMKAHAAFDPIWKQGGVTRKVAYDWLSRAMGIDSKITHIGMFNEKDCEKVIELCRNKKGIHESRVE